MTTRIFLVGLMGAGKTHWGKRIAASLGWQFIDLDAFIEENEKISVAEIFEKHGEAHFRLLEKKYLEELSALNQVVVSVGGGAPCFYNNMQLMNQLGETYYLRASIKTIAERIEWDMSGRPLLRGKTKNDLPAFLEKLLDQREAYYLQASHLIEAEKLSDEKNSAAYLEQFFSAKRFTE